MQGPDHKMYPMDEWVDKFSEHVAACDTPALWEVGKKVKIEGEWFRVRKITKKDIVLRPCDPPGADRRG